LNIFFFGGFPASLVALRGVKMTYPEAQEMGKAQNPTRKVAHGNT